MSDLTVVRSPLLLSLMPLVVACHDAAELPPAGSSTSPAPAPSSPLHATCDFSPIPRLAVFPDQTLLDGVSVAEPELESTLSSRQQLLRSIGGKPISQIVVQVDANVSKERIGRLLADVAKAGFVDVTRLDIPMRDH